MTFTEAVTRAKQGDNAAWEELYTSTCKEAYFVAVKVCGKEQDASDLVQDAYITAYQRLDQLQDPEKFRSWLNMIVANHCRDYLKKKRPALFSEIEPDDGTPPDWADDREYVQPDAQIDHEETVRLVAEIVSSLPEDQRLCVMLYYKEEMSVSEIAKALEVSDGTVKSRLNYARQKVAKKVKELEKQGTKLYGLAPLPFLLFLLRKEADAATTPSSLAFQAPTTDGSAIAAAGTKAAAISEAKTIAAASAKTAAGIGAKFATASLGAKIAAGALAAAVVIGGGVLVHQQIENGKTDPPAIDSPAVSDAPFESTPVESELPNLADAAYCVYEELLTVGVTESGMAINYYAYLDLNSDGIPELLASEYDGTADSWNSGVLYTYKDSSMVILGATSSRYEPFYLVNGQYLLGRARMGNQFFSCDESLIVDGHYSGATIQRNGGDWESITENEFYFYHYMPEESTALGVEGFIKTAEPISLQKNTLLPTDVLADNLDFAKAWRVIEDDDDGAISNPVTIFVFNDDKTFYHTWGYTYSSFEEVTLGQYEINGDLLTLTTKAGGKTYRYQYRVEVRNQQVWLVQLSETGIFFFDEVGKAFLLEEDLDNKPQRYIEAYQG